MGTTKITITCDTGHEAEALRSILNDLLQLKKGERIDAISGDGEHLDGALFEYYTNYDKDATIA